MWLAALSIGLVACRSAGPTQTDVAPAPTRSPALGLDWGRASAVERPKDAFALPSPGATFPFSLGKGRSGHPLHFPGQAIMADVARRPSGDLVSVGYVNPGWHPVAWTSDDSQTWTLQDMGLIEFTFPVALAIGSDQRIVAVGRSGSSPMSWISRDGMSWESHPVATLGDGRVAERMTAVLTTPDGYLAGGSLGPELLERHARFWRSADGSIWEPVADDAAAFTNAEVRAIARLGDEYVAVGTVGSAQRVTGSVAWTSPDGVRWTRIDDAALQTGRAVALAEAPFGIVAVGSDLTEDEAFAWVSKDGRSWMQAPSEPSRQYHGKIRMTDVTTVGQEVIAVGNYVGLQRGTATSWVSSDGLGWAQARNAPVQEQVELYAVVSVDPGIVAVGSFGAPDDYIPIVLHSPGR